MFSFFELTMLNFIIRIFIRDLTNNQIKLNFIKMLILSKRFFRKIYVFVEEFKRTKKTFQKFKDKQIKQKKLNFLKKNNQSKYAFEICSNLKDFLSQ